MLKQARAERGLTLQQAAKAAGISKTMLGYLETGERRPNPKALAGLARVYDLPLADLYAAAGFAIPDKDELPSFTPYLRSKYAGDLPPAALTKLERAFAQLAKRHGLDETALGPRLGEDEK